MEYTVVHMDCSVRPGKENALSVANHVTCCPMTDLTILQFFCRVKLFHGRAQSSPPYPPKPSSRGQWALYCSRYLKQLDLAIHGCYRLYILLSPSNPGFKPGIMVHIFTTRVTKRDCLKKKKGSGCFKISHITSTPTL